jgi:hypothetical protein
MVSRDMIFSYEIRGYLDMVEIKAFLVHRALDQFELFTICASRASTLVQFVFANHNKFVYLLEPFPFLSVFECYGILGYAKGSAYVVPLGRLVEQFSIESPTKDGSCIV